MAPTQHNPADTDEREAQARLTNMRTQEVSLVDLAANLRRFLLVKRGEMDPTKKDDATATPPAQADDATTKQPPPEGDGSTPSGQVVMPAAAKQTIMDGLAAVLERLTGLAQVVGEAQVDDNATVPADVLQMVGDVGMMLSGLRDQFATPEQQTPPAENEGDQPTEQAADIADPPAQDDDDETKKAGRKIAGKRLKKLQALATQLTELIHELGGLDEQQAKDQATAKADDDGDDDAQDDPTEAVMGKLDELAKAFGGLGERLAAVEQSVQAKLEQSDDEQQALAKAQEAIEGLAAQVRAPGDSRVRETDGDAERPRVQWADDMAAEVQRKREAQAKAS